jgi:RNA polymerase-associated protein LEO1
MHMTKLPNLVGLQLEPFDVESYSPDLEEKDFRGYVHNVVRWRYKKDKNGSLVRNDEGKLERESNARLVKWEDGSMTLHVGSEVFSMDEIKSNQSNLKGYPGLNGYLYLSQKATFKSDDNDEEEPGGTVLECMGPIISRLTVRPSSLQSEAHKALTLAVRQKVIKRAKIAQYVTQEDPEKAKQERIRSKEDLEKEQARKNAARSYHRRAPGMNRRYLEEEEDDDHYDTFNVGAAKRRSRYADEEEMDYGDEDDSEEDEEDIGWTKGKLAQMKSRKKRQREEEKDEEEAFGVEEESEEEEQVARFNKPSSAGKKHRAALFDDDDDE